MTERILKFLKFLSSVFSPERLDLFDLVFFRACLLSYMVVHLHHKVKSCDLFLPYMSQIKIEKRNEEFLMTLPKVCAGYRYVRKYLVVCSSAIWWTWNKDALIINITWGMRKNKMCRKYTYAHVTLSWFYRKLKVS